jgi:hypothetical protein
MKTEYTARITELVSQCDNIAMLDLIMQLLIKTI